MLIKSAPAPFIPYYPILSLTEHCANLLCICLSEQCVIEYDALILEKSVEVSVGMRASARPVDNIELAEREANA